MPWTHSWGGGVNQTSSYTSGSAYVTSDGIGWPNGNPGLDGVPRVYLASCSAAYISGGSGNYVQIVKDGVATAGGTWHSANGTFAFQVGHTGGTSYVGRNTGIGPNTVSSVDGRVFPGVIVGSMQYGTYPSQCQAIAMTRSGRDVTVNFSGPANDGGYAIAYYTVQYTKDGGASWQGSVNVGTGTHTYVGLPPGNYYFRVYAVNALGAGYDQRSGLLVVPAGGKRVSGESFVATQTSKRYNGTSFVDLSIARRRVDGNWIDLS